MAKGNKTSTGLDQNVAGLLCYAGAWVTGIIFLILEKENEFVRFHALQSIIVFGAITIVNFIFVYVPLIGGIITWALGVLALIIWIIMMIKAYQGQMYKLPIAGDIAERNSMPQAR
jgi:uncharacterized membrane protein